MYNLYNFMYSIVFPNEAVISYQFSVFSLDCTIQHQYLGMEGSVSSYLHPSASLCRLSLVAIPFSFPLLLLSCPIIKFLHCSLSRQSLFSPLSLDYLFGTTFFVSFNFSCSPSLAQTGRKLSQPGSNFRHHVYQSKAHNRDLVGLPPFALNPSFQDFQVSHQLGTE